MVARTVLAAAVLAGSAFASPIAQVDKRQNIDATVLQFALTLEHLENVFYKGAIQNFTQADFEKAGYSADYYNNLKFIAGDEQDHVALLSGALSAAGVTPVVACTYDFPYTDVASFITLSSVLEGVGTSAYLAGAPLITSKQYLTVAGAILAVEALHTSYQRAAINEVPFANYLYTPLDPNSVYTLAAAFITSCPSQDSGVLPFTAFPALSAVTTKTEEEPQTGPSEVVKRWNKKQTGWGGKWDKNCPAPKSGDSTSFTAASAIPAGSFVTFVNGLTVTSVAGKISGNETTATIPKALGGQTYVFVTKSDVEGTFDDSQVLFGPAILEVTPVAPVLNFTQA